MEDILLGFGAGVMAAASSFSRILPGITAATNSFDIRFLGTAWVAFGLILGAIFLMFADRLTPHEHWVVGRHGPVTTRLKRVWLMVFAIALHNLPEGMAIGVGFAGNDPAVGTRLATAIAIQDIPEGLVVAVALRALSYGRFKAALIGAGTGLAEPVGAVLGYALTSSMALLYPFGLGFAAGAVLWVVFHEIVPETHRKGHALAASQGMIGGFVVMMLLDTALG